MWSSRSDGRPSLDLGEQLLEGGGAVEAADGFLGQAGLPHDRLDALALGAQRLDLLVALAGADGQGGFLRPPGGRRRGGLLQAEGGLAAGGLLRLGFGDGFFQAAPVPGRRLLDVLGQVVVEMPPVGDLDCFRGALARAVGVGAGPVPADHLGSGVLLQPLGEGARLAVAQQVYGLSGLGVDQDGPVVAAAAEREVIDPEHGDRPGLRVGQRHHQPQHAGPARRQAERACQPRPGPAGQGQRDPGQRPRQRRGAPGAPRGKPGDLLGEGDRGAVRVPAEEPAYRQTNDDRLAARRRVRQPPLVRAVHPFRELAAARADAPAQWGTGPRHKPPATSAASTATPARCGRRRSRPIP